MVLSPAGSTRGTTKHFRPTACTITARTCCERIRRGCTPIGGRVGFLMDRARNNTADVPISPHSFCRLQIRGFQKIRCLIDDVKILQHFLIRNLLRAKSSTSSNLQFPLVVLSPIHPPSLSLSLSFSLSFSLPEKNNVFFFHAGFILIPAKYHAPTLKYISMRRNGDTSILPLALLAFLRVQSQFRRDRCISKLERVL